MLAYVRKNANSTVVWFIIGAIAVVFIFFGLGRQPGSVNLVTVNGEEADPYEFQDLVREASSRQRQASPDDEQYARVAALHEQINRILTRQFGENLGLRPSPRALREAVAAIEFFQVDGRFNLERYQAALKSQRRSATDFEQDLRRSLTSERAVNLVLGLTRTHRPEMMELFHFQEDQVRFDYLFLADEDAPGEPPRPTAEELMDYYALRRENWRRPAEMTVQYVKIIPDDDKAGFTEAELEDYYAQNQDRFQESEPEAEVRAELAGEFKILRARRAAVNLLEDLLDRAEVNPDLADAARSLGLEAALSPAFTAAAAPDFFENDSEAVQRAFSAPLGRVAPPFEGERALVLYVPRTRLESHIPPLDEVREEVELSWKREAADSLTRQRLESLLPEVRAQGWEAFPASRTHGLKSGAGVLAGRHALPGSPPFENSDPQAVTALAFSAAVPGQILPVSLAGRLDGRSGRFLLRLAEFKPADESRLDGPEGQAFEYFLALNKSNLLMQAWRIGLYEASKNRIEIPSHFLQ